MKKGPISVGMVAPGGFGWDAASTCMLIPIEFGKGDELIAAVLGHRGGASQESHKIFPLRPRDLLFSHEGVEMIDQAEDQLPKPRTFGRCEASADVGQNGFFRFARCLRLGLKRIHGLLAPFGRLAGSLSH